MLKLVVVYWISPTDLIALTYIHVDASDTCKCLYAAAFLIFKL